MKKLSETVAGTKGVLLELSGDVRFMSRVTAIGLTVGCPIEVIRNEKKQPILIYGRDTLIALGRMEAEKIQIGRIGV